MRVSVAVPQGPDASASERERAPSLREMNKLDKRQRIRKAARELFSKQGFEATTLRQIAKRAHVALGTLFNYAHDKRDLTFLIFNEELDDLVSEAVESSRAGRTLLDQLMRLWEPHYRYFAQSPVLTRLLLREMTFYAEGTEAARFHAIRARVLGHIEQLVRASQQDAALAGSESARTIALLLFFVYSGAVRWWIAQDDPSPDQGIGDLRRLIDIQIKGLGGRPRAKKTKRA